MAAGKRAQYFELLFLSIASLLVWWRPVVDTVRLALSSDSYTHILLILPISLALILTDDTHGFSESGRARWPGWMLLVTAVFLRSASVWIHINGSASSALSLSVLALVLWWIGSVIVCFGTSAVRSHGFAFGFLFLLVPLPGPAQLWMVDALQHSSAAASEALFRIAHVPVTRDGVILSIPGLDIEVARECSSIRSSTMLIVLTLVLAHLFLHSNWRKVLLVLIAIPLSVAKNAVRIFTIAELTTRVDPSYLHGRLHRQGGVVFLALAVVATILLLWAFRNDELNHRTG